jgi:UDP-3-O-acyl-N-acetylglucosamine deacetylase
LDIYQSTLRNSVSIDGYGLCSGTRNWLTIHPSAADSGISFRRGKKCVPADIDFAELVPPRTIQLSRNGVRFTAVEHILSALYGMFINNAIVEVGPAQEIPIVGKVRTKEFCDAIASGGKIIQDKPARVVTPAKTIRIVSSEGRIIVRQSHSRLLAIDAKIDFPHPIGLQAFRFLHRNPHDYRQHIAPARSFIRSSLLKQWSNGSNTLNNIMGELRLLWTVRDAELLLSFADGKWLTQPLTTHEAAKHKIQDFMGDLALLGRTFIATVILEKPGHRLNLKAIRHLKATLVGRSIR